MATTAYAYKGRDTEGKIVKGRVDAATEGAVVTRLRTMGVSPISNLGAGRRNGAAEGTVDPPASPRASSSRTSRSWRVRWRP